MIPGDCEHLRRYAEIVPDVAALIEQAQQPLPRIVWENPLRPLPEGWIYKRCPQATPVPWRKKTWKLPLDAKPGAWPEFLLGSIHCQEEAALLAGDVVQAQPGENVLDLCAAPGGKTAQLAIQMQDRGLLLANERSSGRIPSLRRTLDRLGISCAQVSLGDGTRINPGLTFDRVLVDAPCTCEGTIQKSQARRQGTDDTYRKATVDLQKTLLRHAIQLCRPGGTIIYSTCTYSPEENEGVLTAVGDSIEVLPLSAPSQLAVSQGVCSFGTCRFREDAQNAIRLWPHISQTGGFFVAKLRRL